MRNPVAIPRRVAERPDPNHWDGDDLLTLPEAVALFWPQGPLTVPSLRTAIRDGRLAVVIIGRKHLVTPSCIRAMSRSCRTFARDSNAQERREP
jgi:hypothetical protein